MFMNFADINRVNFRDFRSTLVRIFDVNSQHDCIKRNLEVLMNKMNSQLYVSVVTNEELDKTLNMCLTCF